MKSVACLFYVDDKLNLLFAVPKETLVISFKRRGDKLFYIKFLEKSVIYFNSSGIIRSWLLIFCGSNYYIQTITFIACYNTNILLF